MTITVNGTNDAPIFSVGTIAANILEDVAQLTGALPLPTDADLGDVLTFTPQTGSVGLFGSLTVDAAGNYIYVLNNTLPAVQALGLGATLTDTFTFQVSDGHGGTVTNALTITVNGTNDAPIFSVGTIAANILEDVAQLTGSLPLPTDADLGDVLTFVPQTGSVGLFGSLTVDAAGHYIYVLNNALPAVQALGLGATLADTFTFQVSDGHGGTVSNQLTITVNGTNDAPIFSVGTIAANILEDVAQLTGSLPLPTDADLGDVLTFTPQTGSVGLFGSLTVDAAGNYIYVLNNALPAVQALGLGASLKDTFTFQVSDGHGGTVSNQLTITVNGTNDAPIFSVGTIAANILEDVAQLTGSLPLPTDADLGDVLTFTPQTGSVGLFGSLTVDAAGNYIYVLNNALPAVQALGLGASLKDTFTFEVSDGHGGTVSNQLTITVNGTNDAPVFSVGTIAANILEDVAQLTGSLPLPTDADLGDVLTFVPQAGSAGLFGSLTVDAAGNYIYVLNNTLPAVQALGLGASLKDTFTFEVSDGHGGTVSNQLTITVNGTNDAPIFSVGTIAANILEDVAQLTGALPLPTDADLGDVLTFTPQTGSVGLFGSLTVDAAGNYIYVLNNTLPAVQALGLGATLTDTFTFQVSDGHGGTVSNQLTITVNGTNDAPIFSVGTIAANILEDVAQLTGSLPLPTDADLGDVLTFTPQTGSVGLFGSLTVDAAGNYIYVLNNALPAVQALGLGATLADTFTFQVSDGHGGTVSNQLTITVNGTNDAPVFSVGTIAANILEDVAQLTGSLPLPTDADLGDVLTFTPQTGSVGLFGSLTVDAAGNYIYVLNNTLPAVQALGLGASLKDTFTFEVSDGHGGTVSNQLTITVNGTNDAPIFSVGTIAANILEDVAQLTGSLPLPTDADLGDVLTFVPFSVEGQYGRLSVTAAGLYTYTPNNLLGAVQGLGLGESLADSFTYVVSDGHGGLAQNQLKITINGTNDAPVLAAATASITEGVSSVSGILPTPVDPDNLGGIADVLAFVPRVTVGLYGTLSVDATGHYTYQLNNALPAVQALGLGASLTETFTTSVSDGHLNSTGTLSVTIAGSNDLPVISTLTKAVTEDARTRANGKLDLSDPDTGDTPLFLPQTNVLGLYGTFSLNAAGHYTYQLNNSLPAVQGLGEGQTLKDTFTASATDGKGTVTSQISLTINGSNDAPSVGASSASIIKTTAVFAGQLVTPTDPDNTLDNIASDTLSFTPKIASAGSYGSLTLNADGTYVYTLNTGLLAVVGLLLGQKLTDTFSYTVNDGHGGTASNTLTLTINGGLSSLLSLSAVTSGLSEVTSTLAGTVTAPLNAVGGVTYALTGSAGIYGSLSLSPTGTYVYTLNAGLAAVKGLGVGETMTDNISFKVTDALGKTATSTISIVISGVNDIPTVSPAAISVVEHSTGVVFGQLALADADVHDTPMVMPGVNVGAYGTLTLNVNGSYSYVPHPATAAVNALGVGETLIENFPVTVSDGHGGTALTMIGVTINGQNDAPIAVVASVALTDDTPVLSAQLALPIDPDHGDSASFQPLVNVSGVYGILNLHADGSYTYTLNEALPAVRDLAPGQTLTETFATVSVDTHGASASGSLTLNIHGTADAPVLAPVGLHVTEDGDPLLMGSLHGLLSDAVHVPGAQVDAAVHFSVVEPTEGHEHYGTLTLNGNGTYSYVLDNAHAAVQALNTGETLTDSFTVALSGQGGVSETTINVTIHGVTEPVPLLATLALHEADSRTDSTAASTDTSYSDMDAHTDWASLDAEVNANLFGDTPPVSFSMETAFSEEAVLPAESGVESISSLQTGVQLDAQMQTDELSLTFDTPHLRALSESSDVSGDSPLMTEEPALFTEPAPDASGDTQNMPTELTVSADTSSETMVPPATSEVVTVETDISSEQVIAHHLTQMT